MGLLTRLTSGGKIPVYLCHHGGAFADRAAYAFYRAGMHVTHREHAGTFVSSGARNLPSGCTPSSMPFFNVAF